MNHQLSDQATAVLKAFEKGWNYSEDIGPAQVAAVLRAVADQVKLDTPLGTTDADAGVFAAHHAIYNRLLDLASELEQDELDWLPDEE